MMEFAPLDSSGTDDDAPLYNQNTGIRGPFSVGSQRSGGAPPYARAINDMENQISQLEQEAYCSVLRAFHAQSDAITWETQSLMTELRTALRVPNEVHAELLVRVNEDEIIHKIREWRQAGGVSSGLTIPSSSMSASRKRQRKSQAMLSLAPHVPIPARPSQSIGISMHPSFSASKHGAAVVPKNINGQPSPCISADPARRRHVLMNRSTSGVEDITRDTLIGRKILIRWPEDNNFHEAVITSYNPDDGLHALVYDKGTRNETWEWVDLTEVSQEDIRWDGEDTGISYQLGHSGRETAILGSRRGSFLNPGENRFPSSQNGLGKHESGDGEAFNTADLIKEVERILASSHPSSLEIQGAKKLLREQERSLVQAIARLPDASDNDSEGGEHQAEYAHGANYDDATVGCSGAQPGDNRVDFDDGGGGGSGGGKTKAYET